MSNEAFDRAVKALGDKLRDGRRFSKNETPETWSRYEDLVRTVLEAVREPTPNMIEAGFNQLDKEQFPARADDCWQAMFDELLKP